MNRYLTTFAIVVILIGCYLGVRYVGAVIHYACAVPEEDCPPPFYGAGDLAYYLTGGELVPLWTQD